jgi:hypothetical protein
VAPLFLVSALLHAYVGWRLLPALPADPAWALGVLLAASAWLTPTALLARQRHRHLGTALVWAGLLSMGLFSSLFVLTLARDVVWLLAGLADALIRVLPVAQGAAPWQGVPLQHASALAVLLASALVTALGFLNARRTAAVVPVEVPVAGLPPALHGFTVAQISDVHVGPDDPPRLPAAHRGQREPPGCRHGGHHRRPGRRLGDAAGVPMWRRWPRPALAPRHLLCDRQPRVLLRRTRLDRGELRRMGLRC